MVERRMKEWKERLEGMNKGWKKEKKNRRVDEGKKRWEEGRKERWNERRKKVTKEARNERKKKARKEESKSTCRWKEGSKWRVNIKKWDNKDIFNCQHTVIFPWDWPFFNFKGCV